MHTKAIHAYWYIFLYGVAIFAENDFDLSLDLIWWVNDIHGVSLGYSHSLDNDIDIVGLKYLYSWR